MCFSATASFAAAGALTVVGGLTLAQARKKTELPFASIPLLFGVQQAVEGAVWLSFGSPMVNTLATYVFSMFSHVLWPMFVPLSVLLIETNPTRKKILRVFSFLGLTVGLYLLYFLITDPVTAQVVGSSIAYNSPHLYVYLVLALYVIATCGSCLFSSHRVINVFGVALFIAFSLAAWFYTETFFSVWCFFAAILSAIIYCYFQNNPASLVERGSVENNN